MNSIIYDSGLYNVFRSMIHLDMDAFKMMLVTSDYVPDKDHAKRVEISDEIPTGNGYIRGGLDVDINIVKDQQRHRINITLGSATWTNTNITSAGAIYYKVGSEDLVCCVGFAKEASSVNGSFTVNQSTVRIQN